jgi:hypothetical protein
MYFTRFTIFLALSAWTLSCRNNFTATTSSSLTGVKDGKGLQVRPSRQTHNLFNPS